MHFVLVKTSEKIGTGRVRPSAEYFETNDDNANAANNDGRRNYNKNPRQKRVHKPRAPAEPEFQHPILDKIVISKTSVQDRLLRSKMLDEKDNDCEPKIESESLSSASAAAATTNTNTAVEN